MPHQSINFILFLPRSAYIEINFTAVDKKKETMAKRYTLNIAGIPRMSSVTIFQSGHTGAMV